MPWGRATLTRFIAGTFDARPRFAKENGESFYPAAE